MRLPVKRIKQGLRVSAATESLGIEHSAPGPTGGRPQHMQAFPELAFLDVADESGQCA